MPGPGFEWIGKEEEKEVLEVLRDRWLFRYGDEKDPAFKRKVKTLEEMVQQKFGTKHALAVTSGTAALITALSALGIGPGDEVIVPGYTFIASMSSIIVARAVPVLAEIDESLTLDPADVEKRITPRTKAIMVVHYGGTPVALARIRAIAEQHGIPVIEDAAHALGARYDGAPLGRHSEYVMFSLQAIKHMTTVDGGMLAVRRSEDLAHGRRVRWFGMDRKAARTELDVREVGYKYHMNNVNAVIGSVQLEHIGPVIARHIDNGRFFDQALRGIPGLELTRWDEAAEPSYWFYTVLAERRDDLARYLTERGIGNTLAHKRNDLNTVFAASRRELPGVDRFYARMLHIPCGWWVSDEDRDTIVDTLKRGW